MRFVGSVSRNFDGLINSIIARDEFSMQVDTADEGQIFNAGQFSVTWKLCSLSEAWCADDT